MRIGGHAGEAGSDPPLALAAEEYLGWLASHGYVKTTVAGRAHHLRDLIEFLGALDITEPAVVSFAALESYQRHLFHHKKANGAPLSFRTQAQRIIPVKASFAWLLTQGRVRVDPARGTVFVRQGKGARGRHVPIGARALLWVSRYSDLVRPKLVVKETDVLFLSASGEPICADWLSRTAKAYIAAGAPGKRGSCHLFRHTAATLMLEGGADIRYISEMLGHAKLETTALYTRVSIAKLRAVHAATHPAGNDLAGAEVRLLRPAPSSPAEPLRHAFIGPGGRPFSRRQVPLRP